MNLSVSVTASFTILIVQSGFPVTVAPEAIMINDPVIITVRLPSKRLPPPDTELTLFFAEAIDVFIAFVANVLTVLAVDAAMPITDATAAPTKAVPLLATAAAATPPVADETIPAVPLIMAPRSVASPCAAAVAELPITPPYPL